jgi:methylmalonyl-CoA/ethylmalonyl-CoA epimerase
MIKGMDHVGIAVENIDDMVSFFKDTFGANETSRTEYPELQQISAKVNINGATEFELMQPTGPDGAIGKFMKQSPKGGMHHISIRCDNIEKFVDELEKKGITVVGKSFDRPVKVAFIHPKSAKGLLIELKETSD